MYTYDQLQIIISALDFSIDRLENYLKHNSNYLSVQEKNNIRSAVKDYKSILLKTGCMLGNNETV